MHRLIALVLGAVWSVSAVAQEATPFRCPLPGLTITFSDNSSRTFTRQEGLICYYKLPNNSEAGWLAGVVPAAGTLGTRFRAEIEKLWPARIGTRSEFFQHEQWGYQIFFRERKTITIPAGTFDVLVIDVVEEGIRQNNHKSTRRYYYAPDVGYSVRYEPILERGIWGGTTTPQTVEAIKISTPNAPVSAPAPTAQTPTTSTPSASIQPATGTAADRLRALKDLFDQKLINQAEYEQKRKAILDGL